MHETQHSESRGCAALITGAGKRLGRVLALALARDGWDIVVHYRHSGAQAAETVHSIEQLGRRALALPAELTDESAVADMFKAANDALPVRAVINNASVFESDSPAQFTAESLSRHLGPNLTAPMQLTQLLYHQLEPEQRGVVINILDQKLDNLNPDFFSYTLSKYALWGATRMMATAFAPRLRVLGVSPGLTLPSYLQDEQAFDAAHSQAALLDHSSRPQDIAACVTFLADQPAVTGVNLTVDGGQHLMGLNRDVSFLDFGNQ